MPLPKEYLATIPEIYRDILAAFPSIDPSRKRGYGLAIQTIWSRLEEQGRPFTLGEIRIACENLANQGFAIVRHEMFVHPTELGEEAIADLTGRTVPPISVPPLPPPPVPHSAESVG